MHKKLYPHLAVKRSQAGLGLYTRIPLARGARIIEYCGEKISSAEADRRGGKYLFTLTSDTVIDGKDRANTARYINHSCRPNCEAEVDEDAMKIWIYAKRAVRAGEELTYDYGREYWEEHIKPTGCKCEKCLGHFARGSR